MSSRKILAFPGDVDGPPEKPPLIALWKRQAVVSTCRDSWRNLYQNYYITRWDRNTRSCWDLGRKRKLHPGRILTNRILAAHAPILIARTEDPRTGSSLTFSCLPGSSVLGQEAIDSLRNRIFYLTAGRKAPLYQSTVLYCTRLKESSVPSAFPAGPGRHHRTSYRPD